MQPPITTKSSHLMAILTCLPLEFFHKGDPRRRRVCWLTLWTGLRQCPCRTLLSVCGRNVQGWDREIANALSVTCHITGSCGGLADVITQALQSDRHLGRWNLSNPKARLHRGFPDQQTEVRGRQMVQTG